MGYIVAFGQKDKQTDSLNFQEAFQGVIDLVGKNGIEFSLSFSFSSLEMKVCSSRWVCAGIWRRDAK
jgi:hypothetical protein